MDIEALKAELLAGHPGTGPYNADDALAARELNQANRAVVRPILQPDLTRVLAKGGRLAKLKRAAEQWALSAKDTETSAAMMALAMLTGESNLDISKASDLAVVDSLVATGIFTAADKTAIVAQATVTMSRANEIGLGLVYPGHVQTARL